MWRLILVEQTSVNSASKRLKIGSPFEVCETFVKDIHYKVEFSMQIASPLLCQKESTSLLDDKKIFHTNVSWTITLLHIQEPVIGFLNEHICDLCENL